MLCIEMRGIQNQWGLGSIINYIHIEFQAGSGPERDECSREELTVGQKQVISEGILTWLLEELCWCFFILDVDSEVVRRVEGIYIYIQTEKGWRSSPQPQVYQ